MSLQYVVSWLASVILACYVIREVKTLSRDYVKIKQAVAQGDQHARVGLYWKILRFEWIAAPLALIALGFDKAKLMASALNLDNTAFGHLVTAAKASGNSGLIGALVGGILGGLIIMTVARLRGRLRGPALESAAKPWWRKVVPDVSTLIPTTGYERRLFAAVAVSAGICEEIVFRGWLLYVLHMTLGFNGTTLVVLAAAVFGLCHIYQGPTGVVGASAAGLLLTAVYVAMGTLLWPIILHAVIDLRVAVLPRNPQVARTQAA